MSNDNDSLDQAKHLRERMNNIQIGESPGTDPLQLPPRSKVHKAKDEKKKAKIKLKYPIIRILVLLFILLPIAILSYTYYEKNQEKIPKAVNTNSSTYREEIEIDTKEETKQAEEDVSEEVTETPEVVEEETSEPPDTVVETEKEATPETSQPSESPDTTKGNFDIVFHTVKKEETLYSISQRYYKNRSGEDLIKEWNQLTGNEIVVGSVLKIPIKAKK